MQTYTATANVFLLTPFPILMRFLLRGGQIRMNCFIGLFIGVIPDDLKNVGPS
jgi:hypothetical protein